MRLTFRVALTSVVPVVFDTGVAGFIESNLLETLLGLNQRVVGLDNFSTGYRHNLEEVRQTVRSEQWDRFTFIEGDIRDLNTCQEVCTDIDHVLHQAALRYLILNRTPMPEFQGCRVIKLPQLLKITFT